MKPHNHVACLFLIFCIHFIAVSIILQSLSLCIFTKILWSTINFKTENGSRLITQYYAFTIYVDQFNFLCEKFGVSAYSQERLVADQGSANEKKENIPRIVPVHCQTKLSNGHAFQVRFGVAELSNREQKLPRSDQLKNGGRMYLRALKQLPPNKIFQIRQYMSSLKTDKLKCLSPLPSCITFRKFEYFNELFRRNKTYSAFRRFFIRGRNRQFHANFPPY